MVWKKTVSDEYYICVTPWQSLKTFIWLHFSAYLSPSSNYRFPKQRRVQGQGKVFHQLDKASWTNISAGQIVNHLVRARSNKVFEENHHLSRDAGTTCSFVTCDFFRGYCWNLRGINHTQKWINPKKKRMAFSSLGETLSLQNHTKSWKGHPATPSPPPDTLPPDLASMVTSLGLLVKSFFFCTCPVFTKQAVDAWHMQLTSFWRLFFQS